MLEVSRQPHLEGDFSYLLCLRTAERSLRLTAVGSQIVFLEAKGMGNLHSQGKAEEEGMLASTLLWRQPAGTD